MNSKWQRATLLAASFLGVMFLFLPFAHSESVNAPLNTFYERLALETKQPYPSQISFLETFISEHPGFEQAYLKLVERSLLSGRLDEAKSFFKKLINDDRHSSTSYWALARIYEFQDRPDSAFLAFKNAAAFGGLPLSFYADFITFDMQNSYCYSALHVIQESSPEAAQQFSKAIYLNKKGYYDQSNELLSTLNLDGKTAAYYIAENNFFLAHYDRAEKAIRKYLAVAQEQGELRQQAIALNFLFTLYWRESQKKQARKTLSRALDIAQQIDDKSVLARISINSNFSLARGGDYKKAAEGYLKAAATFLQFHDYRRAARSFNGASECYYMMSLYSQALEAALQSLGLYQKTQHYYEMIKVMITLSKIYRDIEQDKISLDYLNRASALAQKYSYDQCLDELYISRQKLAAKEAPPEKAVAIYKHLLETFDAGQTGLNRTYCFHMCAQKYETQEDLVNALKYYDLSLKAARTEGDLYMEAWTLSKIAELEKNSNSRSSLETFEKILALSKRVDDKRLESYLLIALGDYFENNRDYKKATNHYLRAMEISESLRDSLKADEFKIGFMSNQLESYRRLSELYAKRYKEEKQRQFIASVFRFEEMQHARSLKDEIQRKLKKIDPNTELVQNYQKAVEHLRLRQLSIRQLKDKPFNQHEIELLLANLTTRKYELLTKKIELAHQLNDDAATPYTPTRLFDLQSQLKNRTILIYHLSDRKNFVLAINADSVDVIFLPDSRKSIKSNVNALVMPMHYATEKTVAQTPFHAQLAYRLYLQLFRPVEEQFPLKDEVFIIPEKEITSLPFEMLLYKQPEKNIYTPKEAPVYAQDFLINKHTFFYGPTTVELLRKSPVLQHPSMLLLANPFENEKETPHRFTLRFRTGWRFEQLPYADLEIKRIKRLLDDIHIITGSQATETALQQNANHDIIHISTHAFADTMFDAFSGLALAVEQDSTNDGLLQGFEITSIGFNCDLVVLSACETGRGRTISGEGVLALPRQFLLAGAHTVIMSQWKVDDYFTALMMPRFYANYFTTTMNKAVALKQSKLGILNDKNSYHGIYYQHPFFWASFNLYGDPGSEHPPYQKTRRTWPLVLGVAAITGVGLLAVSMKRRLARQ